MRTVPIDRLRQLIGESLSYQGSTYRVIEVMADGPALVLRSLGTETSIQGNQYGEASRRLRRTVTLPIHVEDGNRLNPELADLLHNVP